MGQTSWIQVKITSEVSSPQKSDESESVSWSEIIGCPVYRVSGCKSLYMDDRLRDHICAHPSSLPNLEPRSWLCRDSQFWKSSIRRRWSSYRGLRLRPCGSDRLSNRYWGQLQQEHSANNRPDQ